MRSGVVRARAARGGSGLGAKIITSSEKEDARDVEEAMDPQLAQSDLEYSSDGFEHGNPASSDEIDSRNNVSDEEGGGVSSTSTNHDNRTELDRNYSAHNLTTKRKKKKTKRGRRKKKRRPTTVSGTAKRSKSGSRVPPLTNRPHTANLFNANGTEEKLRVAKSHNADLFRRLADAKRQARAARAESNSKSEQLRALSNHLEKMMALLRAEAAAKASAEDALKSTEDELESVKQGKSALARELASLRLSEKDELKRDSMLSKQLELMDEKYATLLRTNNFNRAREARESKSLRAKMHTMAESMHSMMRECEDAKVASRNTVHAFSCLVSRLGLFDRTPFRVAKTGSSTKGREMI